MFISCLNKLANYLARLEAMEFLMALIFVTSLHIVSGGYVTCYQCDVLDTGCQDTFTSMIMNNTCTGKACMKTKAKALGRYNSN